MNKQRPQFPRHLITLLIRLKRAGNSEEGFIIFITVAMVVLLSFLWMASALMSKVDTANADAAESSNTGFYAAESGLNQRADQVRQSFQGYGLPSGTSPANWQDCLDESGGNNGSGDMACQTRTLSASRSSRSAPQVTTFMTADEANPWQTTIPTSEPYGGLQALEYRYNVTSVALNKNKLNQPSAILGMQFKSRLIPLFQFAIFYNDDADFTVPPTMTINGRVHSNADLYLNVQNGYTLSINGIVSAAGVNPDGTVSANPLIRGQKDNQTAECGGTVRLMRDRGLGWQNLNCNGSATRTRYSRTSTSPSNISDWGSNLQLGVPRLTVPAPGDFAPSAGSLYWDRADLRVVLNVVNDATNPSGTRVSSIEVQNADGSQNSNATTALNSCTGMNPAGTAAAQTILTAARANNQGQGFTPTNWLPVTNSTAGRFRVGDTITIGDGASRDWDGNVIIGPVTSATDTAQTDANAGNTPNLFSGTGNYIRMRQRLREGTGQAANAVIRKAVVSSSDTFYNYREKYNVAGTVQTGGARGQYIRMLNVDVRELMNCAYSQPNLMGGKLLSDTTDGGLVWYFTVDDNLGNTNNYRKYGIRLYNGRYLAPSIAAAPEIQGLTVVSNQAVYVQGDYNLKDDNTTTPASVADDPNTTRVERWRPASILADSINILSNRWRSDDFNGIRYDANNVPESQDTTVGRFMCVQVGGTPNNCDGATAVSQAQIDAQTHRPAPTQTWVNTAFLAGTISPANEGDAVTGGVNNYPRFHEHWNGTVPFNYRGSFVSLRQPTYTVSPFCGSFQPSNCNIYSPPIRNWDYESTSGVNNAGFNDGANLPPLSPRAVYLRQEIFTRSYDRASINLMPNPFAFLPSPSINLGWVSIGRKY